MTDLHRIGHGLSYTETIFIQDKWAEWSENRLKLVPNDIDEDSIVTLAADNTDSKNKTFKGEETHNTNSILIQKNTLLEDTERKGIFWNLIKALTERLKIHIKTQLLHLIP